MAKYKQKTLFPGQSRVPSVQKRSSPKRKKPSLSQSALSFGQPELSGSASKKKREAPASKPKKKPTAALTKKRMRWESDDDASYHRPITQEESAKKKRKVLHPTETPEVPVASTSRLPTPPPSQPSSIPGIEEMSQLSYFDRTRPAQEKHRQFMTDRLQIQPAKLPPPKKPRKKPAPPSEQDEDGDVAASLTKKINDSVLSMPSSESDHLPVPLKLPARPSFLLKRSASDVVPRSASPPKPTFQAAIPNNDLYLPPKPLSRSISAPSVTSFTAIDTNAQPAPIEASKSSQVSTQSQTLYEDTPPAPASPELLPSQPRSHPRSAKNLFAATRLPSQTAQSQPQSQIIESLVDSCTYPYVPRLLRSPSKSPKKTQQTQVIESFVDSCTAPYVPRLLRSPSKSPLKSPRRSPGKGGKKVSFAPVSPSPRRSRILVEETQYPAEGREKRVLMEETQWFEGEQEVIEDSQFPEIPWVEEDEEIAETQYPYSEADEQVEEKSLKRKKVKLKSFEQQKAEAWSGQRAGSRQKKMGDFFDAQAVDARVDEAVVDERKLDEERKLAALVKAGLFGRGKESAVDAAEEEEVQVEEDENEIISSQTQFIPTMAPESPPKRIQVIPSSDVEDEDDPDLTLDEEMDTPIGDWALNPNTKQCWDALK